MTPDELERRVNANLKPLDVKSAQDAANEAFQKPVEPMKLETVETKPAPELAPSIGILEAFSSNLQLWWQQNVGKYFKGEEIQSPTPSIPSLNWKWLAIGAAVIGVLIVLLKWIV